MATIIVLFNLKPGVDPGRYEAWARSTDLPIVRGLPAVQGFDVHRFCAGRPLRLCGVTLPSAVGLEGHSDDTSGGLVTAKDRQSVQCDFCHRLVDPPAAHQVFLRKLQEFGPGQKPVPLTLFFVFQFSRKINRGCKNIADLQCFSQHPPWRNSPASDHDHCVKLMPELGN